MTELDPETAQRALYISAKGWVLTNFPQINRLREMPFEEVEIYSGPSSEPPFAASWPAQGMVRAGPANEDGYVVHDGTRSLSRDLYVLRLHGNADTYLGRPANGRAIYKIGLSASPDMRRQTLQNAMPRGAFRWSVDRTSSSAGFGKCPSFDAAVSSEYVMKQYLVESAEWLGGEFYLASEADIEVAWRAAHAAIKSFGRKS
ncbi:hypothetical protein H5395_10050 [Paracoccus sp. MC1854]|nr:hypothetical protein [Paracoccus sp. MC1854]